MDALPEHGTHTTVCLLVQLTNTILDIVQQAANYKQLRKGANEGEPFIVAFQFRFCFVEPLPEADNALCSHQDTEPRYLRVRGHGR